MDYEEPVASMQEEIDRLHSENELLKGALAAQDERERLAGEKCGVTDYGCDWPDWVAERVLHLRERAERAEAWLRSMENHNEPDSLPACPECRSHNGSLGTSNAYFICRDCKKEWYWTPDHRHPCDSGRTWDDGVMDSPWARPSILKNMIRKLKEQIEELQDGR